MTTSQKALVAVVQDAKETIKRLEENGQESRALGLAVTCDLILSAAFLFSARDRDCEIATDEIRIAIEHAQRAGD